MARNVRYSIILPILLLITFLIEGILAIYFRGIFVTNQHAIAIQLLVVVMLFIGLHVPSKWTYALTFIMFLFYDSYYSPFLAFTTIAMMITFTIIKQFSRIKQSFLRDFFVVGIGLFIVNSILYIEAWAIGYRISSFPLYVSHKIIPTMLFNLLMCIVCYLPLKKIFIWLEKDK